MIVELITGQAAAFNSAVAMCSNFGRPTFYRQCVARATRVEIARHSALNRLRSRPARDSGGHRANNPPAMLLPIAVLGSAENICAARAALHINVRRVLLVRQPRRARPPSFGPIRPHAVLHLNLPSHALGGTPWRAAGPAEIGTMVWPSSSVKARQRLLGIALAIDGLVVTTSRHNRFPGARRGCPRSACPD